MRAPRTLTARLVATAVLLVLVVTSLIAGVTAVVVHRQQMEALDAKVLSSVRRAGDGDGDNRPTYDGSQSRRPRPDFGNQGPGTVIARIVGSTATASSDGIVLTDEPGGQRTLSSTDLSRLARSPATARCTRWTCRRSGPTG